MSKLECCNFELAHVFPGDIFQKRKTVVDSVGANTSSLSILPKKFRFLNASVLGQPVLLFSFVCLPGLKPGCRKTKEYFVGAGLREHQSDPAGISYDRSADF